MRRDGDYIVAGRSPHGERGLKFRGRLSLLIALAGSLPSRGAWIEIFVEWPTATLDRVAPLTGSVD